jgi:CubicO group peptidase (beta-lactamase class C family)
MYLALLLALTTSQRPSPVAIQAAVDPPLQSFAHRFNVSLSFGWADGVADESFGLAAGFEGFRTLVPVGSMTKTWTAVAVMQQGERAHYA